MNDVARLPATPTLTYDNLIAHELANVFDMIQGKEFEELKADIKAHGILVPITMYNDGSGLKILDGRNRYAAAKAVGHTFLAGNFKEFHGTLKEAEAAANSANAMRRHLTNAQKQAYIRRLINKYPGESNRQIARIRGFSHVTVGDVRDKMLNPPERKRFEEFKKSFDELPDEQRLEFVREFASDIAEMLQTLGVVKLTTENSRGNHLT
jgi:ParB-like nuclease domain